MVLIGDHSICFLCRNMGNYPYYIFHLEYSFSIGKSYSSDFFSVTNCIQLKLDMHYSQDWGFLNFEFKIVETIKKLFAELGTGHWRCTHITNTKLLKPLYILLYRSNRRRRMSTPKVGGETWWCVWRYFLWRILGYTYQHCMRCVEKL